MNFQRKKLLCKESYKDYKSITCELLFLPPCFCMALASNRVEGSVKQYSNTILNQPLKKSELLKKNIYYSKKSITTVTLSSSWFHVPFSSWFHVPRSCVLVWLWHRRNRQTRASGYQNRLVQLKFTILYNLKIKFRKHTDTNFKACVPVFWHAGCCSYI